MRADLDQQQLRTASRIAPLIVVCVAVAALSLLLPSTLTFDPLTWATWGREIAHLRLNTRGGPAWKPFPVLVDVLFSPLGPAEKWAWLVLARAGGLFAVAMAYRLARRVAGRWAGVTAAGGLVLSDAFLEYLAPLGMSEPLLAGLALFAIERHLDGRHRHAHALLFACLLLRPETFPYFAAYSIFVWVRYPRSRKWVTLLVALLPVVWLLPDYVGSGDWLRSPKRAQVPTQGGPLLTGFPALAVLESAFNAVVLPVVLGAVIAAAWAAADYVRRRERDTTLLLGGLGAAWLVEEALVTQARMGSGDQRYLIVGYALLCVLAGIGWARLVGALTSAPAQRVVLVVVLIASGPFVWARLDELSANAGGVTYEAHKYRELPAAISQAGGRARILACGPVMADIYQMPALAWDLDVPQSRIDLGRRPTGTVFRTRTTRHSPVLPAILGSPDFAEITGTDQWQVLSTCGAAPH